MSFFDLDDEQDPNVGADSLQGTDHQAFVELSPQLNNQVKRLAPPVSTASISACVQGIPWNLEGSWLRSNSWLFDGSTGPRDLPE